MATPRLWSSVGSAGTVNPPDAGKVVLVGSLVQLGAMGGVINPSEGTAVARTFGSGPETQAVIRYNVTAVDGIFGSTPVFSAYLGILCRRGSGQIAARLVQVSLPPTDTNVSSVVETTLVQFQSGQPNAAAFALEESQGSFGGVFDFENNAYYVELTLSASGNVVSEDPPAVAVLQINITAG
jgi:hypothetical protein